MGRNDRKVLFDVKRVDDGLKTTAFSIPIQTDQYVFNKIRFTTNKAFSKQNLNDIIPGMVDDLRMFLSCGSQSIFNHNHKIKKVWIGPALHTDIINIWDAINFDRAEEGNVLNLAFMLRANAIRSKGYPVCFENVYNWPNIVNKGDDEE